LLQRIKIDIGTLASGYIKPGQFIQAKLTGDAKPGFFALASPPSSSSGENASPNTSSVVELLIKAQGETAEALSNAAVGSPIQVSPVMGEGFPIERIPPQSFPTVLIFATGSGISPIKALIESGALEAAGKKRKDVRLYFGANDPSFMAYKDLLNTWESKYGVAVIPVYSDVDKKYVQDAFAEDTRITEWSGVAAVLCGQKEMCTAVTDLLTSKGVDKQHILTNF
jgi:arabinosyltransferase